MFTHVVGGACGLMGLKGSTSVGSFLQALRAVNSDYLLGRLLRSFLRFRYWINILWWLFINDEGIVDRGSSSKSLRVLLVTNKRRTR
jgi:hypothetical protein